MKSFHKFTGLHDGHLLADSGYPLRPFCLTPYSVPTNPVQERYNRSLLRTRRVIEQAIGILKRRFPCLHLELRNTPEHCTAIIVATVVLHNIAIEQQDEIVNDDQNLHPLQEGNDAVAIGVPNAHPAARRIRDDFALSFFN